ncbi:MAG: hypothetical protein ACYDGR_15040 [Candidatus Dormibacteria bacterium]
MNINLTSSVRQACRVGLTRRLAALIAVGAALAFPVMANAALADVNVGSTGPYKVASSCNMDPVGYSTDGKYVNFAFTASADSASTNGSYPIATSVHCTVTDQKGASLGSFGTTLVGPHAEAVDIISFPLGAIPQTSSCGSAYFSDAGYVSTC